MAVKMVDSTEDLIVAVVIVPLLSIVVSIVAISEESARVPFAPMAMVFPD
jgi:hypothetical protein